MSEAEQRRYDLDREVNSADRNQPSHAQTQLVEVNWVLRDRRVEMMEHKDRVDHTVKAVTTELREMIYATD